MASQAGSHAGKLLRDAHVDQLQDHPESGSIPPELKKSRYRQLVEPPCRVFYRYDGRHVYILHVMRSERLLRKGMLSTRNESHDS